MSELNLESGQLVGGYTLISRLGAGAMGSVWRVRDDGGQVFAMKILRDSLSEDDLDTADPRDPSVRERLTARERLRREAMALRKVHHPGVCTIVDMELDDSLAFIVTELIEGKNLRDDVAANGRYVADDLERLTRKLIEAVRAVHAAGIVHRDIKPTNVMISATGPVLVDFGIAMGEGESHVTRTGMVMGTPGFIAPEIIDGAESDEQTDWWSLSSVLAFAATGAPVFGTKPMMAVLERAAAGSANLAGLPAGTMAAFRSALNPDRSKRCTPEQLLQAIELDALNPTAWDEAQSDDGSGVVLPFDRSGKARRAAAGVAGGATGAASAGAAASRNAEPSIDNPRSMWRGEPHPDHAHRAASDGETRVMDAGGTTDAGAGADTGAGPTGTTVMPSNTVDGSETTVLPDMDTASGDRTAAEATETRIISSSPRNANDGATTAMPTATTVMPTVGDGQPRTASNAGAGIGGAPPRMASNAGAGGDATTAMPGAGDTTAMPNAGDTTMMPPSIPPESGNADTPDAQYGQAARQSPAVAPNGAPPAATQAGMPPMPNVNQASIRRSAYYSHGLTPCLMATAPICLLAASFPLMALALAFVVLWMMLTAGLNTEAQLRREEKRGGVSKSSDALRRTVSLPWHVLKALALTVPRMLAALVLFLSGTVLAIPVAQLPRSQYLLPFGPSFSLTLPNDMPSSTTGLTLALFAAISWILATLLIPSDTVRIGASAVCGLVRRLSTAPPAGVQPGYGQNPAPAYAYGPGYGQPDSAQPGYAQPANAHNARISALTIVMGVIWLALTVIACILLLTGVQVNWMPLIG